MAISTKATSIILSVVIASGLVAGAFYLSQNSTPIADAGVTDELLRAYADLDTDGDLLPDWQEALYGSDPSDPRSVDPSMTDSEAVAKGLIEPKLRSEKPDLDLPNVPGIDAAPDSVTGQFARELFGEYFAARSDIRPSGEEIVQFVTSATDELALENDTRAHYQASDIKTLSNNSKEALTQYANTVVLSVADPASPAPQSELVYFYEYITTTDTSKLRHVRDLGRSYIKTADAYIRIPVPSQVAGAHLELANALYRTGEATEHMGAADTDPLRAMVGLGQYASASTALESAFRNVALAFSAVLGEQTP